MSLFCFCFSLVQMFDINLHFLTKLSAVQIRTRSIWGKYLCSMALWEKMSVWNVSLFENWLYLGWYSRSYSELLFYSSELWNLALMPWKCSCLWGPREFTSATVVKTHNSIQLCSPSLGCEVNIVAVILFAKALNSYFDCGTGTT